VTARRVVVQLAGPGVGAVWQAFAAGAPDVVRAAALVEIAGAAALLARTLQRDGHLDPVALDELVTSAVDARAVLGRGRWLPTMVWHRPQLSPEARKRARRAAIRARGRRRSVAEGSASPVAVSPVAVQASLFGAVAAGLVAGGGR
jgi:hypothetical protein